MPRKTTTNIAKEESVSAPVVESPIAVAPIGIVGILISSIAASLGIFKW